MNSLESGSNVQSGLEMIMEKSPDTIVLVDRNLTLVKVISAKDDYYHYLANELLPILAIKDYYANGVSQTSFYRIRNKAVINLVDNLLKIH